MLNVEFPGKASRRAPDTHQATFCPLMTGILGQRSRCLCKRFSRCKDVETPKAKPEFRAAGAKRQSLEGPAHASGAAWAMHEVVPLQGHLVPGMQMDHQRKGCAPPSAPTRRPRADAHQVNMSGLAERVRMLTQGPRRAGVRCLACLRGRFVVILHYY